MTKVRGVRGATTADSNNRDDILEATTELIRELVKANDIDSDDIASAFFSTTPDLNAAFPATAARHMGWEYVALMSGQEMSVPGGQPRCIRVLLLVNTDKSPKEIQNVYLKDAMNLRARDGGVNLATAD